MTWRGTTTLRDRIFACLPYLLTLVNGIPFGNSLIAMLPQPLETAVLSLFLPVAILYTIIPFAGLVIFFALFLLVVRNERINHFVRFNTMQALIISIALFLCGLLIGLIGSVTAALSFVVLVLNNAIFLVFLGVFGYSVIQSLRGNYAEIPKISDAVYSQVQ